MYSLIDDLPVVIAALLLLAAGGVAMMVGRAIR
jgi:hypothetical protein